MWRIPRKVSTGPPQGMFLIDGKTSADDSMPKSFDLRKVDSCASARGWMRAAQRRTPGLTPICRANQRLKWPIVSGFDTARNDPVLEIFVFCQVAAGCMFVCDFLKERCPPPPFYEWIHSAWWVQTLTASGRVPTLRISVAYKGSTIVFELVGWYMPPPLAIQNFKLNPRLGRIIA
jgi:hypothetical protein